MTNNSVEVENSSALLIHDSIEGKSYGNGCDKEEGVSSSSEEKSLSILRIFAMLAPGFSWGCIATTMVLLTLPLESQRVNTSFNDTEGNITSLLLALFVFLGGVTELLCPVMGKMSDDSISIPNYWGRRIPFILLGSLVSFASMVGMAITSWYKQWTIFALTYTLFMVGMNIIYSSMIALIPDLVPKPKVGQANGILALEMVVGSLFGFAIFQLFIAYNHTHFTNDDAVKLSLAEMYTLYMFVLLGSSLLAFVFTEEKTDVNAIQNDQYECKPDTESKSKRVRLSKLLIIWKQAFIKVSSLKGKELYSAYTVSQQRHGDFFFVTASRTLYYMGISVQTFFLYYIHDILRHNSDIARESPQTLVSALALVVQIAGAFTCYPAGYISDQYLNGQRKPLIYWSCALLSLGTFGLIFTRYVTQVEIICIIVGLANGGYLTMETSLAVDSLANLEEEYDDRIEKVDALNSHSDGDGKEVEEKEGSAQLLGIWGVAAFVGKFIYANFR